MWPYSVRGVISSAVEVLRVQELIPFTEDRRPGENQMKDRQRRLRDHLGGGKFTLYSRIVVIGSFVVFAVSVMMEYVGGDATPRVRLLAMTLVIGTLAVTLVAAWALIRAWRRVRLPGEDGR